MNTKEFEKQTLEQLLIDLKDIDNYKSFRKGSFVYDLGHYQGQLLLQEIERLNNIIKEVREYIENTPRIVKSIHYRDKESNYAFIENYVKGELLKILDKGKE